METLNSRGERVLRVDTLDIEIGPPSDSVFQPEWLEPSEC
jgi:hypothetical protein